ncbi:hypothetical protein [Halarcobacter anaerophilus]|nr:hypothetical protein [Halarcobacter anaerophilus]
MTPITVKQAKERVCPFMSLPPDFVNGDELADEDKEGLCMRIVRR